MLRLLLNLQEIFEKLHRYTEYPVAPRIYCKCPPMIPLSLSKKSLWLVKLFGKRKRMMRDWRILSTSSDFVVLTGSNGHWQLESRTCSFRWAAVGWSGVYRVHVNLTLKVHVAHVLILTHLVIIFLFYIFNIKSLLWTGILAQSVARESHNLEVGSSSLPDPKWTFFYFKRELILNLANLFHCMFLFKIIELLGDSISLSLSLAL